MRVRDALHSSAIRLGVTGNIHMSSNRIADASALDGNMHSSSGASNEKRIQLCYEDGGSKHKLLCEESIGEINGDFIIRKIKISQ